MFSGAKKASFTALCCIVGRRNNDGISKMATLWGKNWCSKWSSYRSHKHPPHPSPTLVKKLQSSFSFIMLSVCSASTQSPHYRSYLLFHCAWLWHPALGLSSRVHSTDPLSDYSTPIRETMGDSRTKKWTKKCNKGTDAELIGNDVVWETARSRAFD